MTDHTTPDQPPPLWWSPTYGLITRRRGLYWIWEPGGESIRHVTGRPDHLPDDARALADPGELARLRAERDALQARIDATLEAINRYAAAFGDAKMLRHLRAALTGEEVEP